MTLKEFKAALVGRKLIALVVWSRDREPAEIEISKKDFIRVIGGDVPHSRDGLHESTPIVARVDRDEVIIG